MTGQRKRGPKGFNRKEVLPHIYAEVAAGRALDRVLREDDGMPAPRTFWSWHMEDEDIQHNLARARENGVERLMGECVDIADTPIMGERVKIDADGEEEITREDMLGHRRLQIDTRFKYAQMIKPRKYGPRVDVTSGGERIVERDETETVVRGAAMIKMLEEALARDDRSE